MIQGSPGSIYSNTHTRVRMDKRIETRCTFPPLSLTAAESRCGLHLADKPGVESHRAGLKQSNFRLPRPHAG